MTNKNQEIYTENSNNEGRDNHLREVLSSMQSFSSISNLMRLLGALALVAGMSVFLLQGWGPGDDSSRFLMMLAQTILMTVSGFSLHFFLKENKGARLFFGLSLVSVAANLTVLGALIYSVIPFDSSLFGSSSSNLPSYATWVAADASTLLLSLGIGLIVLVPVTLFGFQLLARGNSKVFSVLYLGLGTLLLIPVRDPSIVVGIIAIGALVLIKTLRSREMPNTWERKFASTVLFIPLTIMAFRSLYFYDIASFAMLIILGVTYYGCRALTEKLNVGSAIKTITNLASMPLAAWLSITFFGVIHEINNGFVYDIDQESLEIIISTMVFAGLMVDLYLRSIEHKHRTLFSTFGTLILALGIAVSLSITSIWLMTLASIVVAILWSLCGYFTGSKTITYGGALIAAFLMITEFITLISVIDLSNWMVLSILGGSTIVIASVLERHGAAIKERAKTLAANRA